MAFSFGYGTLRQAVSASILRLSFALCLALCGCTPTPSTSTSTTPSGDAEPRPAPTLDPAPEDTFVLVWLDAPLHRRPGDDAPLQIYDFDDGRAQRPGQALVARLVARQGPWHELVPVARWLDDDRHTRHCIGTSFVTDDGLEVVVWVHEDDLAPVLTRTLTQAHPDGTSVTLEPGVPIVGGNPWFDGYTLPIDVDPDLVGTTYQPKLSQARARDRDVPTRAYVVPEIRASLGGTPVPYTQPAWNYAKSARVWARTDVESPRMRVVSCGVLELAYEGPGTVDEGTALLGVFGSGSGATQAPAGKVEPGTALHWPDGGRAGVVTEPVTRVDLAPSEAPQTCIDIKLGLDWKSPGYRNDRATVCIDTAAIKPTTAKSHGSPAALFEE